MPDGAEANKVPDGDGASFLGEGEDRDGRMALCVKAFGLKVGVGVGASVAATVRVWVRVMDRSTLATSL